jgi:4-hydroxyproline epimerase
MSLPDRLTVIDSHTEGEPTRVVLEGAAELTGATMAARRDALRRDHDDLRRALVREPRGQEATVGALLTPPVEPGSLAGVIFFDNTGYLDMCGHGTIGVVRTLDFLGRLPAPRAGSGVVTVRLDTPAGTVEAETFRAHSPRAHPTASQADLNAPPAGGAEAAAVTIANVPSRCTALDVAVEVSGLGAVRGDVAYGGNWFFLLDIGQLPGLRLARGEIPALRAAALRIRAALAAAQVTGDGGAEIEHIEILGPSPSAAADGLNFVLCPGGAYDRSPCGTGTSAHLAALFARGQLAPGRRWCQESLTGGRFTAWLTREGDALVPHIRGRAFVTSQATLFFLADDPFREGLPPS